MVRFATAWATLQCSNTKKRGKKLNPEKILQPTWSCEYKLCPCLAASRQTFSPFHFIIALIAPQCCPASCFVHHQLQQQMYGERLTITWAFFFPPIERNNNEWGSQTKLLYTKVQLSAEGALLFQPVEACRTWHGRPRCTKMMVTLLVSCGTLPTLVCLNSDTTFFFLCLMYSLIQSCVCLQTGTLGSVQFFL